MQTAAKKSETETPRVMPATAKTSGIARHKPQR